MRVLVAQHHGGTGLGQVGTALAEAGAEVDCRRLHLGEPLPASAADHDAIVILGGVQNALDDAGTPYFPQLLELIRDFAARDRSVLGICLGSQLIARAFGAENLIGTASEFGWSEVAVTPEANADSILSTLPERFPIFQWHDDTFRLPDKAVRLAGNGVAENQAFRIGRAVYGFQFHFEADRPMVRDWMVTFGSEVAERYSDWNLEAEMAKSGAAADAAGLAIARRWVAVV